MSKLVSLICIVNKQNIYEGFIESLKKQSFADYQLIPVMNMNNEFKGARSAFNQAALQAEGKYLMFIHPDIRFLENDSLEKLVSQLEAIGDFGVVGVAGAAPDGRKGRKILTSIVQGDDKEPVGEMISEPVKVMTVDECLFVVRNDWFEENSFSQREGWHLYGVEYCLDALKKGKDVYVVPSSIWHMSKGASLDEKYMTLLEEMIGDISDDIPLLCTTVKAWKTRGLASKLYRKYYYAKQLIKRKLAR